MVSRDLGIRGWRNSGKQNKQNLRSPLRVGNFYQLNICKCARTYITQDYITTIIALK